MQHNDDELTKGLLKNHRQFPPDVREGSVAMGYHSSAPGGGLKRSRRSSWRVAVVLLATGAVCVMGLVALGAKDSKTPGVFTPDSSVVASDQPGPATLAEWRFRTVGQLMGVFMNDAAMKSGDYRTNELSAQTFCPSLVKEVAKAMNNTGPAPDEQLQKHYVAMLTEYKAAGDKCVAGDMGGSFASLQAAERDQKAIGALK